MALQSSSSPPASQNLYLSKRKKVMSFQLTLALKIDRCEAAHIAAEERVGFYNWALLRYTMKTYGYRSILKLYCY